jgi:hypothetical protein
VAAEPGGDHGSDVRIGVDRVDDAQVGVAVDQVAQRQTDLVQGGAEVLATVGRHQEIPVGRRPLRGRELAAGGHQQGVDDGVAGDMDGRRGDPLPEQVPPAGRGRGEVELGQVAGEDPVLLLRERGVGLARAEPRLDVAERDPMVIAGQGRAEDRGGVPLRQDEVGALPREGLR